MNNVIENNKLIAEFMGAKFFIKEKIFNVPKWWFESWQGENSISHGYAFTDRELYYHKSWDWLMPVAEKIEGLGYDYGVCGVTIKGEKLSEIMISPISKSDSIEIHTRTSQPLLQATYEAVLQFIKWYNLNKTI